MKKLRHIFILFLPLLVFSYAENISAKTLNPTAIGVIDDQHFDPITANQTLNTLQNQLLLSEISLKKLQAALTTLNKLQLQAKKCADTTLTQLNKLEARLTEINTIAPSIENKKDASLTEEQKYLDSKKQQLNDQLSECRLFSLRSDEVNAELSQKIRVTFTDRLMHAHSNILENLQNLPEKISDSIQALNLEIFSEQSGFEYFSEKNIYLLFLPILIIFSIYYTNSRVRKKLRPLIGEQTETLFSLRVKQALVAVLYRYLPIFTAAMSFAIFFSIFTHSLKTPSGLALASYGFLTYIIFILVARFFFCPPSPAEGFAHLPNDTARTLVKRLKRLALLCLTTYLIVVFLWGQPIQQSLIDLFRTTVITLFSIYLISVVWIVQNLSNFERYHTLIRFCSSFFLIALLVFILMTEYLGYHLLAQYLLYGIVMTMLSMLAAKFLNKIISVVLKDFDGTSHPWQQNLRASFGLKPHERLIEILWLRVLLYVVVWLGFLIALLKIWGLGQANFQLFVNFLIHGGEVGKLHIVPSRIISGVFIFILLILATRWLRHYIIKNPSLKLEASNRESLASIVGYIGFALAFIIGALIAGVNFSGLALIAGALAVGIGFGLQSIVNNFVSGIILLIERPVKLGDRILIGGTEGYVKKISIRSTRIMTTQYSDVIVPNSELVAQQVTNYMLHDLNYQITISIGLAYGSDTELAKNVLLSLAKAHPQVVSDRKDMEPTVYFRRFGDSTLNFDLVCVIKDVNNKSIVVSDLNFAIDKAFRERGIDIPFPQQDIRIKELPKISLASLAPPASPQS